MLEGFNKNAFWKILAYKALSGDKANHRVNTLNEDEWYLLNHPVFKKAFTEAVNKFKLLYENNKSSLLNGFILHGSWVNGIAAFNSDLDLILLFDRGYSLTKSQISETFSDEKYHPMTLPKWSDIYFGYISDLTVDKVGQYQIESLTSMKFLFLGIPFGREVQALQRSVLDYIGRMSQKERDTVWGHISETLLKSEQGNPDGGNKEEKYFVLGKQQLTFEKYKERWVKRCEFANRFCRENGIEF